MRNQELARLFYNEILKNHNTSFASSDVVAEDKSIELDIKINNLFELLKRIFSEITSAEKIQFTTLFSRIAFAFQKYEVPPKRQYLIHQFRKKAHHLDKKSDKSYIYQLGLRAVTDAIRVFYQEAPPSVIEAILPSPDIFHYSTLDIKKKTPFLRVVVLRDDSQNEHLIGVEENTSEEVRVQYNITERNENFRKSIAVLKHYFTFPVTLHLLDNEVTSFTETDGNEKTLLRPRAFVIEPDHLIDVTAIAECFRKEGAEPLLYLLKKFMPYEVSTSIMKGNIANFFLDELIANPEVTFQETIRKVFKINPLAFCLYTDKEFREIVDASQGHFIHLKRMVTEGLPKEGIIRENCYLEPSFYAPKYGLQGRLDLLYQDPITQKSAIVELKSGTPFKPNIYGIANNHFTQTLLYDLLVSAAFDGKTEPLNYILYSVLEKDNLKYAPSVKAQQYEALNIRNQILGLEQTVINLNRNEEGNYSIFKKLISKLLNITTGFEKRDIALFDKVYSSLTELENRYFNSFCSFIAREHQLAKVGMEGSESLNGVASLWINDLKGKEENFNIFSFIKLIKNDSALEDALLVFNKTERTNPLANFRIGDIVVLYPAFEQDETSVFGSDSILKNQIFKCTLVSIETETITLRLRSRQLNQYIFKTTEYWHVEHDLLDSSFTGMYRSLFEFMRIPQLKRDILLTLAPPQYLADNVAEKHSVSEMTDEQNHIFNKIIHSKDYFLLWGPPGTGKTSIMLKHLVGHFFNKTTENLLLLAYTNRAVDEICEAIEGLGGYIKEHYIRIGSRYSTSPQYHEQLLDFKIGNITTRKDLKGLIEGKRIFVATVASMTGKPELFKLKKFNRVIIDEASQILEPILVGLLPQFDHFTLIGDHKQLPAVVTQSVDESAVSFPDLNEIGLKNLRNSLFERLFKQANRNGWHWAFDILSHQGRMHQEIMDFPSKYFYENKLQILPEGMNEFQKLSINQKDKIGKLLENRVAFINSDKDKSSNLNKTNVHEAHLLCHLVDYFNNHYSTENMVSPLSIGIITPYRAQIAQIQSTLKAKQLDVTKITVDTVERYQGGARDIILISLCTNDVSQLSSLISLSEEGVDRKLNVALTRARKHLIVIGNVEILSQSEIYKWFIDEYRIEFEG
jgi:DNA replication ATP-dependent helicase Dna2